MSGNSYRVFVSSRTVALELGRLGRLINVGDWLASCGPTDLVSLTTNLLENAANLSRGHPARGHIIACGARCGWGSETTLRCLEEQYQPQPTEPRIHIQTAEGMGTEDHVEDYKPL